MARAIRRNHTGHRMGEDHHRAKLSDAEVAAIRADYRPGQRGHGYQSLAYKYETSIWTIRDILTYRTRP
jgi:hypothetical protein